MYIKHYVAIIFAVLIFIYIHTSLLINNFRIILFTMYFPIKSHHHSIETYINLSKIYFGTAQCEVVFYTDIKLKNIAPHSKKIYSFFFDNVTSIPIIEQQGIGNIIKNKVNQIYHSKVALLYYISKIYTANIYFFNDITTFHYRCLQNAKNYPNPDFVKSIFDKVETPILFTIYPNRSAKHFIQGGCFGGKRNAIKYLYNKYYQYLHDYYKKHGNIEKTEEQILDIMISKVKNAILIPNNPDNCSIYKGLDTRWFYFISVLSGYPKECIKNVKFNNINDY